MHDDKVKYADCMTFVRYRVQVIDRLLAKKVSTGYEIPDLETTCLQFRMIFELVAMSSLCANKERCQEVRRRFDKLWNAAEIVKFVEQINPNFYPIPIVEVKVPNFPGGAIANLPDGFLTKDKLVEAHGRCGDLLHSSNPYSPGEIDAEQWNQRFHAWRERLVVLLNSHKAHLVDSEREWWVNVRFGSKVPVVVSLMRKLGDVC